LSPGTAITGFPPGTVNGGRYTTAGSAAGQAQLDLTTAYNDAAGRAATATYGPIFDLGGQTLTPGVYNNPSSFGITGTLTLDAAGDPNAVWIFQAGSTLITLSNSQVVFKNGVGSASNVFWQVGSSATLGTNSVFKGSILALTSITVTTGVNLEGRALARNGAVTLDTNVINRPASVPAATPATTVAGIATNSAITAIFNKALDPLTVTSATFTLNQGATPIVGTVTYALVTATFAPLTPLAPSTTYTATLTTGVKDLAGNALAVPFVWSFTTNATPDSTPPAVNSTIPSNAATSVGTNGAITAVFSEPLDPLSVTTATFTLNQGATPIAGTVTCALVTATFTPLTPLTTSTVYTAVLTTGVKDLAGNVLASSFTWSFTTAAAAGQAPVALLTAGAFAVLAGSTVTNTGATVVTGDLGLSPGTAVTGFPPGTVSGGTYTSLSSAAAQAQVDLIIAYNDAAGRLPTTTYGPIFDLGGLTLAPGVYRNPSSFGITGTLTLDAGGNPNAVWIFQAGSTLTTLSNSQVVFKNGVGSASNVFWQVGSSATLGTNSVFKGNILALASITVTTGVNLDGRALARNGAVTLDANIVTRP